MLLPRPGIFWNWQVDLADWAVQFAWRGWEVEAIG
jgi:hypothetical protein